MDPFQFQIVEKNHKQLTFQEFTNGILLKVFNIKELVTNDSLNKDLHLCYRYLQGKPLETYIEKMMQKVKQTFELQLFKNTTWTTAPMFSFCTSLVFETTFLTFYGKSLDSDWKIITEIKDDFLKFDGKFSHLLSDIPSELLGNIKSIQKKLTQRFASELFSKMQAWPEILQTRQTVLEKYYSPEDVEIGGKKLLNDYLSEIK